MTDKIIILTYDAPHRKTQDILSRLFVEGIDVNVIGIKWVKRIGKLSCYNLKLKPLKYHPKELCKKYGFTYSCTSSFNDLNLKDKVIIIAGSGLLQKKTVESNIIVNIHPGLLPTTRGLDSVKWAIYNNEHLGVTAHIIDEDIDLGRLIKQEKVNLTIFDSLHSIASKIYEAEIELAIDVIKNKLWEQTCGYKGKLNNPRKRIGILKELQLEYKLKKRFSFSFQTFRVVQ